MFLGHAGIAFADKIKQLKDQQFYTAGYHTVADKGHSNLIFSISKFHFQTSCLSFPNLMFVTSKLNFQSTTVVSEWQGLSLQTEDSDGVLKKNLVPCLHQKLEHHS